MTHSVIGVSWVSIKKRHINPTILRMLYFSQSNSDKNKKATLLNTFAVCVVISELYPDIYFVAVIIFSPKEKFPCKT